MNDERMLSHVIKTMLGLSTQDYSKHDIANALVHAGVERFVEHFSILMEKDIDNLMVPGGTRNQMATPLSIMNKRLLKTILSFYHELSRNIGKAAKIHKVSRDVFNAYRVNQYNPQAPIIPWFSKKKGSDDPELVNWMKTVRPSQGDYKELKDDAHWLKHKEHVLTTLRAHGLLHIINSNHVVKNIEVDELQKSWFYKVLQDTMKAASAKTIVTAHLRDMDT